MAVLGVVVNPAANGNRGSAPGAGVVRELTAAGHEVIDLSAGSAEAAQLRARTMCTEGGRRPDAVVVVGGDGMVHLGVNAVAGTGVPLGLIAIGSGNDFARTVGLPAHDGRAALRALEAALEQGPRPIDVLRADGAHGTRRTACVLSAGFDAAVNARANTYTFPPGGGKYLRAVAAELRGFRPYGYTITIDGQRRELAGTLVAIANGPYFGGGMKIVPQARNDDGLADVLIGHEVTAGQLLRLLPKIYAGTHVQHPAVEIVRAREVVVEPLAGHPPPPDAFGDGELVGALPLSVTVEAGAVQLLAPA